jgi:hypothetical protein
MITGTRFSAQVAITFLPVAAEPVKATLSIGARQSATPVSPRPTTVCSRPWPGSTSQRLSASQTPTPGVSSLGLKTTAFPAASA